MVNAIEKDGAVEIAVRVVPRASRNEVAGEHDGMLKVRIARPPVDGAANEELIKLLAKTFDVSKTDVEILAGLSSRSKRVKIKGLTQAALDSVLERTRI